MMSLRDNLLAAFQRIQFLSIIYQTCDDSQLMESPHDFHAVHWDHEPVRIPLNRPPGTFSPTGGEGWDEGVRFMER